MEEDLQLGYLIFGAADPLTLSTQFRDVFGLLPEMLRGGVTAFRVDDWRRRIVVEPAPDNSLRAVGLVAQNEEVYARLEKRLEARSWPVHRGTEVDCAYRGVREFLAFVDPGGTPVELAIGPTTVPSEPYLSPLVPGGFRTGPSGLGHVVLLASDDQASVNFYVDCLGFVVSDTSENRTPHGVAQATFMHCNRRHHTIAIARRPGSAKLPGILGHVMLQVDGVDAVGLAYDRALDAGMPISRGLGRHPNDHMFSFYARTPAGFDVEIGADAVDITEDWKVRHYGQFSLWGHRPGPGT